MSSWEKAGFTISTDKQYLDTDVIHHFLSVDSYWAKGITIEKVKKSIEKSSICFGMYEGDPAKGDAKQIGFVRAVTDFVRFAWIMDVFVLPEYRGRGLSKWMVETMVEQSELKDVRKMMLCTFDAHGLYEQYGFQTLDDPEIFMQRKI
ncbi:GNAT family N-acetyltransferase [Bacillus sp. EB106-08-02-XG196]|jgi:N-acetylglutamate synthase-like GNAT family acetyltransferase|uniref:GNAT family N-acetyltransferase n=1 Tax=Bacillus sp. EB106-08-02-XG196 TaxID=2737049 RepID=UPI0015C4692C|nr:GNAT family N-acetyltransferase [Bacillus sp. EB106-08-02-XG196]NWQ41608.1 GNAT family N-acetyltransferase [Bacillus sp. EB106-08-02-XG196]